MPCDISRYVDWVLLGDCWTRVSVIGPNPSMEVFREIRDISVVILILPGIPGSDGFCVDFGQKLLRCLLLRDEHAAFPKHRFKLDDQVQHQLDFVREHLPRTQKVHVLGHSIGRFIAFGRSLPCMKDDFNVKKAIGLFPIVEKMAESPNNVRLKQVLAVMSITQLVKTFEYYVGKKEFRSLKTIATLVAWKSSSGLQTIETVDDPRKARGPALLTEGAEVGMVTHNIR
ncbi:unnamed protein product [Angiostrongylus costaricensis]|uniref:Lipid droplet-associated hydrolase n=1 Tax=Angiostrongylus costaricensis TaxID=334426 RepID=A0A158PMB7_ANGCS|nr:unnamed protein product [Angiostrongylus costaricensis]